MTEQPNLDSPIAPDRPDDAAQEEADEIVVPPTRSASIIAFGVVALISMLFGFVLGLLF